jgi:hypothetical protein
MDSGGIIGLGTGEDESDNQPPIGQWLDRYLEVERMGEVESMGYGTVALGTDLNGMAKQIPRSELSLAYPTRAILDADWSGRSRSLPQFQLGSRQFDIRRDGIAHIGMLPDFLSVVRKRAESLDSDGAGRSRRFDQIFHSAHDFIATWEQAIRAAPSVDANLPSVPVTQVKVTLETGTDDLKCGHVEVLALSGRGTSLTHPFMISQGQRPHSTYTKNLALLPGVNLRDISRIRFHYLPGQCDPFDTGDTWNIKTLKVTYDVTDGGTRHQGVLMHKRGAPARKLNRASTWTVYTER